MLQNRVSLGLSSQSDPGPLAMLPTPASSQTTFMQGKRASRDAFLAAVLAVTAFLTTLLTVRPQSRVAVLGPGAGSRPFKTPSASAAGEVGTTSADEWRNALNAGAGAATTAAPGGGAPPSGHCLPSNIIASPRPSAHAPPSFAGGGDRTREDRAAAGRAPQRRPVKSLRRERAPLRPLRSTPARPGAFISATPPDGSKAAQSALCASPPDPLCGRRAPRRRGGHPRLL